LRSDDPDLREQAANLSGSYRIKDAVPYIIEILEKRDVFGSWAYHKIPAIRALAKIGDARAIEPLKKLYRSKSIFFRDARNDLRLEIFKTLKGYPANAIKPLLDLGLKSKNKEIRSLSQRLLKEPQDSRDRDNG
jgi:HEAT repeat protein